MRTFVLARIPRVGKSTYTVNYKGVGWGEVIDLKVIRETPILEILDFLIDLKVIFGRSPIS